MSTLLAQFQMHDQFVRVAIVDRDDIRTPVLHGEGESVHDAFSDALSPARVTFKGESDELDACVAAMRDKRLSIAITDDVISCYGFL